MFITRVHFPTRVESLFEGLGSIEGSWGTFRFRLGLTRDGTETVAEPHVSVESLVTSTHKFGQKHGYKGGQPFIPMFSSSSSSRYVPPPVAPLVPRDVELGDQVIHDLWHWHRQALTTWRNQLVGLYPADEVQPRLEQLFAEAAEALQDAEDHPLDHEDHVLYWELYGSALDRLREHIELMRQHQDDWYRDQLDLGHDADLRP